jgi:hypothetical protein
VADSRGWHQGAAIGDVLDKRGREAARTLGDAVLDAYLSLRSCE